MPSVDFAKASILLDKKIHKTLLKFVKDYEDFRIVINTKSYTKEEFENKMRGLWDGDIGLRPFECVRYDSEDNPNGVKPRNYISRKMLFRDLEDGYSDWLFSTIDDSFVQYDRASECWKLIEKEWMEREITDEWYRSDVGGIQLEDTDLNKIIREYRTFTAVNFEKPIEELLADEIIPLKNGALEWKTLTFRPYKKEDFCCAKIPREYNPKLGRSEPFEKMLLALLPDPKLLDIIYCHIASIIRGYNYDQWFLMLVDKKGGTGKGTIAEIETSIIGEDLTTPISFERLEKDSHGPALLMGKRLAIISETESTKLDKLTTFKRITGGDLIDINPKNAPAVKIRPKCIFILLTNNAPKINPKEDAFWRRPVVIQMGNKPFTREEYDELMALINQPEELDKIANTALKYIPKIQETLKWYHENYNVRELYEKNFEDPVYSFLDCFVRPGSAKEFIHKDQMYEIFRVFCDLNDFPIPEIDRGFKIIFGKKMGGWCNNNKFPINTNKQARINGKMTRVFGKITFDIEMIREYIEEVKNLQKKYEKRDEDKYLKYITAETILEDVRQDLSRLGQKYT